MFEVNIGLVIGLQDLFDFSVAPGGLGQYTREASSEKRAEQSPQTLEEIRQKYAGLTATQLNNQKEAR